MRVPDRTRARSLQSHVRAVACECEKLRVHKSPKQRIADVALQTPQALRLRGRQSKSRHFYVFTLNSLKHVVDTHEVPQRERRWFVYVSESYKSNPCTDQVLAKSAIRWGVGGWV